MAAYLVMVDLASLSSVAMCLFCCCESLRAVWSCAVCCACALSCCFSTSTSARALDASPFRLHDHNTQHTSSAGERVYKLSI